MALVGAVACPAAASGQTLALSCDVSLPANARLTTSKAYGSSGLDLSGLAAWAASCGQTTTLQLSVYAPSAAGRATITGDQSSAGLFNVNNVPFLSFSIAHVALVGYGDGTAATANCAVYVNNTRAVALTDVRVSTSFGYATGPVTVNYVPTVSIASSVFAGNRALGLGTVIDAASAQTYGGALFVSYGGVVLITNCTFYNNSVPNGVNNGGALAVVYSGTLSVRGSTFANNTCVGVTGANWGGAIMTLLTDAVSISSSTFTGNVAGTHDGSGGAVYVSVAGSIAISHCRFVKNTCGGSGGAGGALATDHSSNVRITYTVFDSNTANTAGAVLLASVTGALVANVVATRNVAFIAQSGAAEKDIGLNSKGGFMQVENSSRVQITKSIFRYNTAGESGGALHFAKDNAYIGLLNLTLEGNVASLGYGGAVYVGDANNYITVNGFAPNGDAYSDRYSWTTVGVLLHDVDLQYDDLYPTEYLAAMASTFVGSCGDGVRCGSFWCY